MNKNLPPATARPCCDIKIPRFGNHVFKTKQIIAINSRLFIACDAVQSIDNGELSMYIQFDLISLVVIE